MNIYQHFFLWFFNLNTKLKEVNNEREIQKKAYSSVMVLSAFEYINLLTLSNFIKNIFDFKSYIIVLLLIVFNVNYYYFISKKKYLQILSFKEATGINQLKKNNLYFLIYIISSILIFICSIFLN